MGTERSKYFLNYDMRKLWMPELALPQNIPFRPPAYPHKEPVMNIGRDWHGYASIGEATTMFLAGIGGLLALAAVSSYDLTGFRARQPWVNRHTSMASRSPTELLNLPPLNPPAAAEEGSDDDEGGDDY
jgi:hypothetical protein